MAKYKVDISGINTSKLLSLTNIQNLELFKKMKEGDPLAREELVNGNLKLVLSILKKFNNKVDNLDDLFQVGCLGLVKAIDNFDTSYNVTLSTYACPMILGEIKRYLRDNNALRISRSIKDLAYKALKLKEELINELGIEPNDKLIAEKLGVTEYEISNKKEDYDLDYKLALDKAMNKLKFRDKKILEERFIIGKTQMEIANELGISQAQISRIEKTAIKTLRKVIK